MKKSFHLSGLHCTSCEILLEKELKKIPGVVPLKISHKKGFAELEIKNEKQIEAVIKTIEKNGYHIQKNPNKQKQNQTKNYFQIALIFLTIFLISKIFQRFDISPFFPDLDAQVSILIAFLLGLVASVSTCLALVGGIVIGFGSTYKPSLDKKHPFFSRALPHLYFHLGRIGGFAILGGILGIIGSKINYSLTFTGYFTIIIGIIMFYIGLQILDLVPNISKFGFHLPKALSQKIHSLEKNNHHFAPILIGILTFFVPCGFTQSMQLAAVSSGNFWSGALIMGSFALGTLPVLISLGIGSTYAQKSKFNLTKKILGVVVVFFAVYSLNSGLVLSGTKLSIPTPKTKQAESNTNVIINTDYQTVKMNVDWAFKPNKFVIKKNLPVRWEIQGVNISGCSNEVVIPRLNIRQKITQGETVTVEFTPTEKGVLPFSCWMGMLNGQFIVTE